uniref:Uncharacterized protein n=1 Tax=Octopus bimaculoides TaxID=37653 RepID=A0A0L8GEE5_OCTBM
MLYEKLHIEDKNYIHKLHRPTIVTNCKLISAMFSYTGLNNLYVNNKIMIVKHHIVLSSNVL